MLPINPAQIIQEEEAMTAPKAAPAAKPPVEKAAIVDAPPVVMTPVVDEPAADGQTIAEYVEAGVMKNAHAREILALIIAIGGTVQYVASNAVVALMAAHIVTAAPVWLVVYGAIFSPIATVGGWIWKANISGKKK